MCRVTEDCPGIAFARRWAGWRWRFRAKVSRTGKFSWGGVPVLTPGRDPRG
jgi:hypothetical protein